MSTLAIDISPGNLRKRWARFVLTREHAKRGSFRPIGLELTFGDGGSLPLVVELTDETAYIN